MEQTEKKQKNKFHIFKHHLHNEENDIKYRGPLSYRHLRIIAWVCMMFMALSTVFSVFAKINHSDSLSVTSSVFQTIGQLALPLFLIANFSFIMRHRNNLKKLIVFYGLVALGMMAVAYLFVFRYCFSILTHYNWDNFEFVEDLLSGVLNMYMNKFIFLNVFIDLFLCSLCFAFLTYKPKKYFQGKKIIIFRLFVIFPIIYELGCVYLKLHVLTADEFMIPWYIFPLLTTKPPMLLLGFLILTIIISIRKEVYLKKNNCGEDKYEKFLATNANSLQFSLMTMAVLLFAVIVDIIVFIIVSSHISAVKGYDYDEVASFVGKSGLGQTIPVLLIFPLIFLFSYSKEYTDKMIDKIIPAGGVALCVYAVVESLVQFISTL